LVPRPAFLEEGIRPITLAQPLDVPVQSLPQFDDYPREFLVVTRRNKVRA
jgi:hypothetical protein